MNTKQTEATRAPGSPIKELDLTAPPARGIGALYQAIAREAGLGLVVIALFAFFGIMRPNFISGDNILAILMQASIIGILAIGQTFVLITGGIDLSIGSIVAVSAVSAGLLTQQVSPPLAIIGGIAVGALAGLINGLLITLTGITAFVITLGTMSIYSGLALILTGGRAVYDIPSGYKDILSGKLAGIPNAIVIVAILVTVGALSLRYTKFGEYLIAVGGNYETARLAGIKVRTTTAMSYVISGAAAGLVGAILVARLGAADPTVGADLLLTAIAATVMGGTKLIGGEGSVPGALIGAILIAALTAGLTALNVQAFYQQVAVGSAIIIALLIDNLTKRRKGAAKS